MKLSFTSLAVNVPDSVEVSLISNYMILQAVSRITKLEWQKIAVSRLFV